MKKLLILLAAIPTVFLGLYSCNEDIDLTGDFSETAVVYGLLDVSDSIHMIKITRAFIGPGNSIEIAGIADSSYFKAVDATITEVVNGVEVRSWNLKDTLVTNKDENGIWYAPEQKLYYFSTMGTSPLNTSAIYKLHIDVNNGEFEVNGETELVSGISTLAGGDNYRFKFAQNLGEYKATGLSISTGNSAVLNTTLEIGYEEITGSDTVLRTFDWFLGEVEIEPAATSKTLTMQGESFYDLIAKDIVNNNVPICDMRNFSHIRIKLVGGATELNNYMIVNEPSSALAQNKPTYTNLEATNGHTVIGIFSSRQTVTYYKPFEPYPMQPLRAIDKQTTEELCKGAYTGNYLFCSDHDADISVGYSWVCN